VPHRRGGRRSPPILTGQVQGVGLGRMQRLSGLDTAFLSMETPTNHMHIGWAAMLHPDPARPITAGALAAQIAGRLERLPALRRRLAQDRLGWTQPDWIDVDVDPADHIRVREGLDLQSACAEALGQPLDRSRPLWELTLLPDQAEGRVGLVMKVHHAALDGPSGAELMVQLLDLDPDPVAAAPPAAPLRGEAPPSRQTVRAVGMRRLARGPRRAASGAREYLQVRRAVRDWVSAHPGSGVPAMLSAPRTSFNRSLTGRREVRFASVSLDAVDAARAGTGATVNHVALAVVGGALRRWLPAHGGLPDRRLVALVPLSLRETGDGGEAARLVGGNQTSGILVSLGTDVPDMQERLVEVARVATAARAMHDEAGMGTLSRWAELVPPGPNARFARLASRLHLSERAPLPFNLVVANVAGPDTPFYCCGARVEAAYPMGPLTDIAALNVTVLSYRRRLGFGLVACPDVVADLDGLTAAIESELAGLDPSGGGQQVASSREAVSGL
jgi:diacylglycerol O-acyltransferase / wax synthase